jgi:hypothetical protein
MYALTANSAIVPPSTGPALGDGDRTCIGSCTEYIATLELYSSPSFDALTDAFPALMAGTVHSS